VSDEQTLNRIDELVKEEEQLLHRHESEGLSPEERARLEELKVQLDQAWTSSASVVPCASTRRTPTRPVPAIPTRSRATRAERR
jgi:hypothetical protein